MPLKVNKKLTAIQRNRNKRLFREMMRRPIIDVLKEAEPISEIFKTYEYRIDKKDYRRTCRNLPLIMKNQAKILGRIPVGKNLIVLQRDGDRLTGAILDIKDQCGLCGIRGDIIIALEDIDDKTAAEELVPMFVSGQNPRKRQIGIVEKSEPIYLRNDFKNL